MSFLFGESHYEKAMREFREGQEEAMRQNERIRESENIIRLREREREYVN